MIAPLGLEARWHFTIKTQKKWLRALTLSPERRNRFFQLPIASKNPVGERRKHPHRAWELSIKILLVK